MSNAQDESSTEDPKGNDDVERRDVNMTNSHMADYIAMLGNFRRDLSSYSIVVGAGVGQLPIGELHLHNSSFLQMIAMVSIVSEGSARATVDGKTITFQKVMEGSEVRAYPVMGFLASGDRQAKLEILKQTIDHTLEDLGKKDGYTSEITFDYYPDAEELVLIGSPRSLDIAGRIISALPVEQPKPASK